MNMIKKIIILSFVAIIIIPLGYLMTRPQYTLLSGNNCINCHISPNGGGQRSVLGGYARNTVSLIKNEAIVEFFDKFNELYSFADGKILWGFDDRMQTARMGDPSDSKRKIFLMQFSPYLTYFPTQWLRLSATYNLMYLPDEIAGTAKAMKYRGQKNWSASAIIQPGLASPSLKVGYFSPSIGTKYDDHTLLIRQVWTSYPQMILPPDNNEIGAEISYNYKNWVLLTGGAYGTKSMSEIRLNNTTGNRIPIVEPNSVSYLGKVVFTPKYFENKLTTYFGASYFLNNDFNILSVYAGLGLTDNLSLLSEMTRADKTDIRTSNNYLFEADYQIVDGLVFSVRYETASTDDYSVPDLINGLDYSNYTTTSYVIGANINPIPNVELRPEYRILDRKDFESYAAQWTLQLHLYF